MAKRWCALAGVVALTLAACANPRIADRPEQRLGFQIAEDVPYTSQLAMDVYYPEGDGPWPVAVVLHGGEDHKETMHGFGRAAAARGVIAFVPEWRSFPGRVETPGVMLEDITCAIRFARDRAAEHGGNGERVVMAGWSAGANFAAIAVLREDPVRGDCIVSPDVSADVHGLVGLDGVYDLAEIVEEDPPASWTAAEIEEASAHNYVQPYAGDDPPVFRLFTGQIEQLHAQAERFRGDLEAAGYDVDLVNFPGYSHMGVILGPGTVDALVDLAFGS